jgi:uncharacterized membrane protein
MLVVFPIGLWVFSLVSDLIFLSGLGGAVWNDIAFYTMAGGWIGAILAAVPGLIDMFSITDSRVGQVARNHMLLNLLAVAIFSVDLYWRTLSPPGALFPILLSVLGILVLTVSGWLGGELVYVHGMGVQPPSGPREIKPQRPGKVRRIG